VTAYQFIQLNAMQHMGRLEDLKILISRWNKIKHGSWPYNHSST